MLWRVSLAEFHACFILSHSETKSQVIINFVPTCYKTERIFQRILAPFLAPPQNEKSAPQPEPRGVVLLLDVRQPSVNRDRLHGHALHDRPGTHAIGYHHAVSVPDFIPERLVVCVVAGKPLFHGLPIVCVGIPYSFGSAFIRDARLLHTDAALYASTDAEGT